MCGIVGLMSGDQPPQCDQTAWASLQAAAGQLATLSSSGEASAAALQEKLAGLAPWIESLPGFAAAHAIHTADALPALVRTILAALETTQRAVDQGQSKAEGFVELDTWNQLGHQCRDLHWRLQEDLLGNQSAIKSLFPPPWKADDTRAQAAYWSVEFILRSLNRMEIRGRDSSGISVMVKFKDEASTKAYLAAIDASQLATEWQARTASQGLTSGAISGSHDVHTSQTLSFLYKVASEVGSIGQNIQALRDEIHADGLLRLALSEPGVQVNPLAHTRWASNGIINIYNAHPQGDDTEGVASSHTRLFAGLNGDIDNYSELLDAYTRRTGKRPPVGVTTDAKIIPLLVEERYRACGDLREAFRQALQEFRGSFAIGIHHLDRPEQVLLGIGGSGQSLYLGVHEDAVFYASELYGVVEGTGHFVKLDGEREREAGNPGSRGQMVEINRSQVGSPRPFSAWSFDGTPLTEEHLPITTAQITTRDINIAGYPHFFLKEISESVDSVRKTLHGRFFLSEDNKAPFRFNLGESAVPEAVVQRLAAGQIKQVYCIGQGTAAIAAMGVAGALRQSLSDKIAITATKATELSGHQLAESMEDTLIVAVSQSGTTTDTNRTVDIVRQRGAMVLAILNRRNSDLAFKADGVMFTSDGRDVEMSVASTKAFYSQVTAGVLLGLYLGHRSEMLEQHQVHQSLQELLALPRMMAGVLAQSDKVKEVAQNHALSRRYWAVVGSGANQIAAHEIRIKLSELCYKSMSCDTIEDKKHIDLSAEPLMLVCAAGLDEANLSDTVKEVAIFKAHSSIPIVIASRGADRFQPYATAVFEVPDTSPHLSPILTTIIGHLFGYHAACAIDAQAVALRHVRKILVQTLSTADEDLESSIKEANSPLSRLLVQMLATLQTPQANAALEVQTAVGLALSGQRLLISQQNQEAILLHGHKTDSPDALAQELLQQLTEAIRELSRPIDAIKHQAKTVTVGISRPTPTLKGAIGHIFRELQLSATSVLWRNLAYLIAAEPLLEEVPGATLYRVTGLDPEGRLTSASSIFKETAVGSAAGIASRTSTDSTLKGSKWLSLKKNSVLIGVGRRDGRHIAIIPMRASSPEEARILLLHLRYNEAAALKERLHLLRARGQVYDQFRAAATEINLIWNDQLLLDAPVETLFDDAPDRFIASVAS